MYNSDTDNKHVLKKKIMFYMPRDCICSKHTDLYQIKYAFKEHYQCVIILLKQVETGKCATDLLFQFISDSMTNTISLVIKTQMSNVGRTTLFQNNLHRHVNRLTTICYRFTTDPQQTCDRLYNLQLCIYWRRHIYDNNSIHFSEW